MSNLQEERLKHLAMIFVSILIVTLQDLVLPVGYAAGIPYAGIVFWASIKCSHNQSLIILTLCCFLVVFCGVYSEEFAVIPFYQDWSALYNRVVTMLCILGMYVASTSSRYYQNGSNHI